MKIEKWEPYFVAPTFQLDIIIYRIKCTNLKMKHKRTALQCLDFTHSRKCRAPSGTADANVPHINLKTYQQIFEQCSNVIAVLEYKIKNEQKVSTNPTLSSTNFWCLNAKRQPHREQRTSKSEIILKCIHCASVWWRWKCKEKKKPSRVFTLNDEQSQVEN